MNRRFILITLAIVGLSVPLVLAMFAPSFSLVELAAVALLGMGLLAGGWIAMRRSRRPPNPAPGPASDTNGARRPASPPDAQATVFLVGAILFVLLVIGLGMGAHYAAGVDRTEPASPAVSGEPTTMVRSVNPMAGVALPLIVGIGGGLVLIVLLASVTRSQASEPAAEDRPDMDWNTMLRPEDDEEGDDSGIIDWWVNQLRKKDD